ncbi:MAG: hypothetical protein JWO62_2555 [Acidimicrobiaceae bacterium]|nr:hypothetical protein [Acidimicrobiaceae bacterium]
MADHEKRATHEQWMEMLSECSHLARLLKADGQRARSRLDDENAPAWDAYPASSLPESSIASGRVHRPVEQTVVRYAGGKDADGEGRDRDDETTPDTWEERHDPIGTAVRRMEAETFDACNRLATAQAAAFVARGMPAGEVFGSAINGDSFAMLLAKLARSLSILRQISPDLRRSNLSPSENTGRNRLEAETFDARNRLRTAVKAMNDALPTIMAEPTREKCCGCGTAKDVITYFGQHPQYWISGDAKCRECVRRPRRANGKAS